MKAAVFLNAAAGSIDDEKTGEEVRRVAEALRSAGLDAQIQPVEPTRLAAAVREAARSGVDAVVVGGGDGTLSAAAGALAGGATPLGILPLGTLNHFAKDLGIPLDLDDAAGVVAAGRMREVDVGEVNGRVFVNNSSIGIYPRLVESRESQRVRHGRAKWLAMAGALLEGFRRFPLWRVRVRVGDRVLPRTTPFVFVGNNEYQESFLGMRGRSCLDRGELSLYIPRATTRRGMLKLIAHALAGTLDRAEEFESMCLPEVDLEAPRRFIRVAVDGEVTRMRPPLRYRVRPRALRVLAPAAEDPSARVAAPAEDASARVAAPAEDERQQGTAGA